MSSSRTKFAARAALSLATASAAVLACATGPTYSEMTGTLPALGPDSGRIVLYVTGATEVPQFFPQVTVDGQIIGVVRPSSFLYVDRPAGAHVVGVHVKSSEASTGIQAATTPVTVLVEPGTTSFVHVNSITSAGQLIVQLMPETTANGQRDVANLPLSPQN